MKKTKRMISLIACLVLMFCLLPAGASAGSDSNSITVKNTVLTSYTASARLTVTSSSVSGVLEYGTGGQTMYISAMISTADLAGNSTGTRPASVQENMSTYTPLYVSAYSNQRFTYAQTYNTVTTLITSGTIVLRANA